MIAYTIEETDWARDAAQLGMIRRQVFIVEQGVPETLEWDADDPVATHFLALTLDGEPIGCARLLPGGRIGRMAVRVEWRGHGVGSALLDAATAVARSREMHVLTLSAQLHAAPFYARAGFSVEGDVYEEAGIPHVRMSKRLTPDINHK